MSAPPVLPAGQLRAVTDRGELFVRTVEGPPDARPALLVHGWQATADLTFHGLYEHLGARHHVVAADLRGHGRSLYTGTPFSLEDAADDVAALHRDLGLAPAIVVGYSLGTAVAQVLAARHADVVAGLVLVGGELGGGRRLHEKTYLRAGGWHGTLLRGTTGRWAANRLVDRAAEHTPAMEQHRAWLTGEMERGHAGALRDAGRALGAFDGTAIAAACTVPTCVVVTRHDRAVRPGRQEHLARAWRASIVDLEADHDAPVTRPVELADAVLAAVATVDRELQP